MSALPSIPSSPVPGKDPPHPSSTMAGDSPQALPVPEINSQIPPDPSTSLTSHPSLPESKHLRPSPLRQTTSSSVIPPESAHPGDGQTRPPFTPFFTLVHDPATSTTHHPSRIHYLFSDDEDNTDLLSSACIRSLNASTPEAFEDSPRKPQSSSTSSSSSVTFSKPREGARARETSQREERVLIIDVNESGDAITNAASLSSSWQILNASISNAPTWDGADPASEDDAERGDRDRGLMLMIEGTGIEKGDEGKQGLGIVAKKAETSVLLGDEEVQSLLEGFDRKMGILRKIVAAGEGESGGLTVAGQKPSEGKEEGKDV